MLKITKNQGSIQVTADKSGFYPFDGTITFPTNSLFTATSANTDMITFKSTSNGDVQFVGNYKDITISGRSYDTKQKFLTAFSNLANQGSVDAYTKAETDAKLNDKLTAQKNAKDSLFISSVSNDDASSSVALYNSSVRGTNDVAIGFASTLDKKGVHNLAILAGAEANGSGNIAIGLERRCKGLNNIGIGTGAGDINTIDVVGEGNVCIGANSQSQTDVSVAHSVSNSVAIGYNAKASSNYCTVVGNSAHSKSSHAVAVGDSAYVDTDSDSSVAVGNSARAYGKNSVAIGNTSYANDVKPLDICCGKKDNNEVLSVLQSDATGKLSILKGDGTDTRMVIQDEIEALKNSGGGGTVDGLVIDAKKVTAGLEQSLGLAQSNLVVIGNKAEAYGPQSVVIGQEAYVNDSSSTAIGYGANCTGEYTIAVGYRTITNGYGCIAIGDSAKTQGSYNVAIGDSAESSTVYGIAIGYKTKNTGADAVVIGANATSSAQYGLSIGYGANADNSTPLVIKAGKDSNSQPLTVLQSDSTGKLSILKGDGTNERIVIQDEIAALKNAGGSGGGTVDAYTKAETDTKLDAKQDKLTAGNGITITKDETAGTNTIATAVSLTDNGEGAYQVGDSIKMGSDTVAIGKSAVSRTKWSIAIGNGATSDSGGTNIAIGNVAISSGGSGIAIGNKAETSNFNATAIGTNTLAGLPKSIAIGYGAKTSTNIPMVINAGGKTMFQGDANGKISIPLGDGTASTMCLQDEIAALKAEIAALKGGSGASTGA